MPILPHGRPLGCAPIDRGSSLPAHQQPRPPAGVRPFITLRVLAPGQRRRSILPLAGVLLGLALSVGACAPKGPAGDGARPQDEAAAAPREESPDDAPALVETIRPRRDVVRETITLSGDLESEQRIELTSRTSGVVLRTPLREGDAVEADGIILELEADQQKLSLRERELAVRDAEEKARTSRLQRDEASRAEQVARLSFERADREFARLEGVLAGRGSSSFSAEEIEAKTFARDQASIELENAQLAHERAKITEATGQIAVESARLARDRAQLDLDHCTIRAPIDGVISYLQIRPGELLREGTHVVSIVNRDHLYTEIRVPQRRLSALRIGQQVRVEAETVPGRTFPGSVTMIHPTVDPEQGTVKVRVSVTDEAGLLRPGIYVSATVVLEEHSRALLVPKRARLFEGEESILFLVREGRAVRIVVEPGLQTRDDVEILAADRGLEDDDRVVIRGQTHLRDGMIVRVAEEEDPAGGARDATEVGERPAASSAATETRG